MAGGSWLLFYEGLNMSKKSVGSIIKNAYLHPFRYGVANRREFWWCEFAVLFFSVLVIFIPFILFINTIWTPNRSLLFYLVLNRKSKVVHPRRKIVIHLLRDSILKCTTLYKFKEYNVMI